MMQFAQINLKGFDVTHTDIWQETEPFQPGAIMLPVPDNTLIHVGMIYDSLHNEFVDGPKSRRMSKKTFMERVGFPEIENIRAAIRSDASVDAAWEFGAQSGYIDLDDPMTAALLSLLEMKGLLPQGAAMIILAGGAL